MTPISPPFRLTLRRSVSHPLKLTAITGLAFYPILIDDERVNFYTENIFPRLNDFFTGRFEGHRYKVLESAHGKILEIGFGSGLSARNYPAAVTQIIGLEPHRAMFERALAKSNPRVDIVVGAAEKLPFAEGEFDGVASFFTLCSVSDLDKVIAEIKRVLKKDGRLFLIEHVAQPEKSLTRKLQHRIKPTWSHVGCGCNLESETISQLQLSGFHFVQLKSIGYSGFPNFLGPIYRGIAMKSGSLNKS